MHAPFPLPPCYDKLIGCFTHAETDAYFEFGLHNPDAFTPFPDTPHVVFVDGDTFRWARVLRTVAYVVVDEDADGNAVLEKWHIKQRRTY